MSGNSAQPLFLVGPTASGKSAVALELAGRLDAEIVSVDSMQVYRGLDIGTAKPTDAERARVPHHLVDVADLSEAFDAARFCTLARAALDDIRQRGRRALFCGGTGLYLKAWLEGLGDAPPSDAALRATLEAAPLDQLLAELERTDPETFSKIDRANPRRVVRAVEVLRLTGRPYSAQRAPWKDRSTDAPAARCIGLGRAPEELRARIDSRVDAMFERGLVAETRSLLDAGLESNRTAMQAIGYRQVVEHLRGERGLPDTVELVKIRTRQFAKRQMTWFRRQMNVHWIAVPPDEPAARTADRILENGSLLPGGPA